MHTPHMPRIMIVKRLEANNVFDQFDQIRPIKEGFDQIRLHSIRSLQFFQKVRPLSFRPEKFNLFTATRAGRSGKDVSAKKSRDVSANFSCQNVPYYLGFVFGFLQTG